MLALPACTQVYSPLFGNVGGSAPSNPNARCNELTAGERVRPEASQSPAPTPAGGAVSPGRYALVAFTMHVPEEGVQPWPARAITLRVAGDTWQLLSVREGAEPTTATFHATIQGNDLQLDRECGQWEPVVLGYSATPDELRLHVQVPNGTGVWVLRRAAE